MKFGKYLALRQLELPEYLGYFIDYKALKKLIKQLAAGPIGGTPAGDTQRTLKENKAQFFFRVERELDKVNLFYLEKQADLAVNIDLLVLKKHELLLKEYQLTTPLRNLISYLNVYQNFKKIHQDLLRLQQFIELNETGFSKVVKKWDKRLKMHTKELFIQTAVLVQPVFHKNEINELLDTVTHALFELELIMDGDVLALSSYNSGTRPPLRPMRLTPLLVDLDPLPALSASNTPGDEIDQLYALFVLIGTLNEPDSKLLAQWVEKVRAALGAVPAAETRLFTRVLTLAVANPEISDLFLAQFLDLTENQVDFALVLRDDFNKTILHECCAIAPASESQHIYFNNGVKVVLVGEHINHLRTFIVEKIVTTLESNRRLTLLKRRDFSGRMCLHYAAHARRLDLLQMLLPVFPPEHVDYLDKDLMSALLVAIKYNQPACVRELVAHGANCFPQLIDLKLQYLPINYACKYGHFAILEFLLLQLSDPALIHRQDVEGLFPLHVLARLGHYKLIKLIVPFDCARNINRLDSLNKWPPLFYAALEGHLKTTEELVKYGACLDSVDEDGYNVLYYCVIEGHIEVLNHLLTYDRFKKPQASNGSSNGDVHGPNILDDVDLEDATSIEKPDGIPDLQLPPPILPLRRYGHNFLEQKVLIELIFPHDRNEFIRLFNLLTDLKPGRITLISNNSDIIPRNVLLPVGEDRTLVFQTDVDLLSEFRIDFEIFPKFGTRLIAKTLALQFANITAALPEIGHIQLPLFDLRLQNIGELRLNYQVIFPFSGTLLETSKFDTYWKLLTNFVKNRQLLKLNAAGGLLPNNFLSPPMVQDVVVDMPGPLLVVTATSLLGEYLRIKICLLNDGTPVVCPHWLILITDSIDLYLPNLLRDQLSSITSNLFDYNKVFADISRMTAKDVGLVKKLLRIIYVPLDTVLEALHPEINLNLEFVFPLLYEMETLPFVGHIQRLLNKFIDLTLTAVFDHIRTRPTAHPTRLIIFLLSNLLICKILNWKQPNFPVFLLMNGIAYNAATHQFESRTTNGIALSADLPGRRLNEQAGEEVVYAQQLTIRLIKEAVNFSMANNLIGLVCLIHLLDLVPKLIPLIRLKGLLLVALSDVNEVGDAEEAQIQKELDAYTRTEINGLRFDDVLSFKGDITM